MGRLMAAIGFLGLTLGALREAAPGWDAAALAVGWALVAGAALGAAGGDRAKRPGRAAFAAAGALLLAVAARPALRARLPLEGALDRLHPRLCRAREHVAALPRDRFDEAYSAWAADHPGADTPRVEFGPVSPDVLVVRWRTPTRDAFQGVGHAAAAVLVAGLIGAAVGRRACRLRRDAGPPPAGAERRSA